MAETVNTSTLREAYNLVDLEGTLKSSTLKPFTSQYGDSIMGEMVIMTGEDSEYRVKVKANKMTRGSADKPPKENGDYKGLVKVMEEYVSVASLMEQGVPFEEALLRATKLKTRGAKLALNEFYSDRSDTNIASTPVIACHRFTRIDTATMVPKCHFEIEGFFDKIRPEEKNDEPTGRVILELIVPQYGGSVIPLTFVSTPDTADYFSSHYEAKRTGKIYGDVVNTVKTTQVVKQGFKKAETKETVSRVSELLADNGEPEQYSEDDVRSYSVEAIRAAMKVRENETLPDIIRKGKEKGSSSASSGFANAGGGAARNPGLVSAPTGSKPPFALKY